METTEIIETATAITMLIICSGMAIAICVCFYGMIQDERKRIN